MHTQIIGILSFSQKNTIKYKLLFKTQDREENCTTPGLLLYCKEIFAYLLANECTFLGIFNSTRAIVHRVVLYTNSKNISFCNIKANEKQALLEGLIL